MIALRLLAALVVVAPLLLLPPGNAQAAGPVIGGCPVFPSDHVWNTPIDTMPLDPQSSAYVTTIGAAKGLKADFGSGLWDGGPIGIPFVTVTGSQTRYPAAFEYADESDPGPYAVPLNAPIEGGSQSSGDRHAIAIDTTNCVLYELYAAYPGASSWTAGSGAIFDLESYALRPAGWTSADAAGLAIFTGLVRYEEILSGEINHAIRFTAPQTRNTYIWPARHKASSLTGTQYPPMGQRFRLRADFDISGYSPANQVILTALKKYGMILSDNGSSWYMSGVPDSRWNNDDLNKLRGVLGSNLEAIDESSLMINVNSGQAKQPGSTTPATPVITSVSPTSIPTGPFALTVNGTGFLPGAVVRFGTTALSTTYESSTKLAATGSAPAASSGVPITVANTTGSPSNAVSIVVTAPPSLVTVTVSPSSTSVRVGKSRTFTATVAGATNSAVVWKVNGIVGGNSTVGTISASGVYRAPSRVPSGGKVTVSAASAEAPGVSGSASVTVTRN